MFRIYNKDFIEVRIKYMIQIEFGRKIQELRKETGLSQEKFALKIGMDRTYYASVESGKRNISLQNIKKIADGFEITITELFDKIEKG
jgi:regulatory protein munI